MSLSDKRKPLFNLSGKEYDATYFESDIKEFIKKVKKELDRIKNDEGYIDCMVCWNVLDEFAGEKLND